MAFTLTETRKRVLWHMATGSSLWRLVWSEMPADANWKLGIVFGPVAHRDVAAMEAMGLITLRFELGHDHRAALTDEGKRIGLEQPSWPKPVTRMRRPKWIKSSSVLEPVGRHQ